MTVCIVTVYNSENCGSFMQAYALYAALKKEGHKVYFLNRDVNDTSHSIKNNAVVSLKKLLKLNFKAFKMEWQKYTSFSKAQKLFPVITKNSEEYKNIDCFIIGSDTIWNLNSDYFANHINTYFGLEFKDKKVISYAASVANTQKEKFIDNKHAIEGARRMADISVRDTATYEIVRDVFGVNPTMVCDPTLLLNKTDYNALIENNSPLNNSPIFIYYFGKLNDDTVKQIKQLKKETGKQIISFGVYREWCDINIPYDPYMFIQCFRDCSFVITNTYHGTIFSLLYQKNFADYGQEKKKVEYLLSSLGAEKAFADYNDALNPFYEGNLDYSVINKKISDVKTTSLEFLKRNLNS